ncbi:MAG TPA: beta-galactosidase [Pseudomonadales bacterium]
MRRLLLFALTLLGSTAGAEVDQRGHYLSFDHIRDLRAELGVLADPSSTTKYRLRIASRLDDALRTPGVRGIWMAFPWRDVEVGDGVYDWTVLDRNMDVAKDYGHVFVVAIADRSFNGNQVMPDYLPDEYVLASRGSRKHGYTAKRWDPYVYNRLIRLYRAIAERYADHPGFGGIATSETATGNFVGGDYSVEKYQDALAAIVTETLPALTRGKLFLYINFLKGGESIDLNEDARVALLRRVPTRNLVIGAPDITPDVKGMVRSVTPFRIHVRKTMPSLEQFCHLQNVDQGLGRINVKSNAARSDYRRKVAAIRAPEAEGGISREPPGFALDDLRDPEGRPIDLHPEAELGDLWQPEELFAFGRRNFGCDYVLWHYREFPKPGEIEWHEIQRVIARHADFYRSS